VSIKATSIRALREATRAGTVATQERRIVAAMVRGTRYSRRQLAVLAEMETSAVPGRVLALVDRGVVRIDGTAACPLTGREVEMVVLA
jgi:hypothetical protein